MAAPFEQMQQFIELRAENVSFAKIAKQIGVSKTTLIDWAKNCELEIENRRAVTYEALINQSDELGEDLIEFVKFGLEYTNTLMDDWWKLDHEERVRCQQLILPGDISFNKDKKVGTPLISPIYSLQPNKKDLRFDRKSLMVELAGTAPASIGLSWLVVYRHSLFFDLRERVFKQTNISFEQSLVLAAS